jgi:activator of HSP90 ATPase
MALKGHGDPRWIVQERADGKNVNNWHWTESDWTGWAKNRVEELFKNLEIETNELSGKVTESNTTGDVSVNTRKGKTILFYELNVTLKWEVKLKATEHTAKGSISMPYISDENDPSDFEVKLSVDKDTTDDEKVKDKLRTHIIPVLREKIPQMLGELKEVALGKTSLQLKQAPSAKLDQIETAVAAPTSQPTTTVVTKKSGVRVTNITLKEKFICRAMDLIQCFIEPNRVKAYAGGDSNITGEKGGKFSLFGGAVQGEIEVLDIPTKLVEKWRFSSWPADHYSTVTLEFEEKDGKTVLKLTHAGIPEDDKERTENGWKDNFFKRIKGIFGYGSLY